MPGETGDSSSNPFAVDPEGNYGFDPRFLAQGPADLEILRTEYPSGDSEEAAAARLADARTDLEDVFAQLQEEGAFDDPSRIELNKEARLLMAMSLGNLIDPDQSERAQYEVTPVDAPSQEEDEAFLREQGWGDTVDLLLAHQDEPNEARWKMRQLRQTLEHRDELASSLHTGQTS